MSAKRITSRCRPSGIRALFDNITARFTSEVTEILKRLHLNQFVTLPGLQQDSVAITSILSCWDIRQQAFLLGGQCISFTADEVAVMLGMPNKGEKVLWQKSPLSQYSSADYKNKLEQSDSSLPAAQFVQLYIRFLISNLFFAYHNYRVASSLIAYADNIEKFAEYNWAEAIWAFLVSQFNGITRKIQTQQAPGYMSGFVPLLMIWAAEHIISIRPSFPSVQPRILRWPKIKFADVAFDDLGGDQVRLTLEDLSEEETWLIESSSHPHETSIAELDISPGRGPAIAAPTDSPYISPRYSPPSSVSSLPSATTPQSEGSAVDKLFAGLRELREVVASYHAAVTERLDDIHARVTAMEVTLAAQRSAPIPSGMEAATEETTGVSSQETFIVGAPPVESCAREDPSELAEGETPTEHTTAIVPFIGSLVRRVKARQTRKRKSVFSPFITRQLRAKSGCSDLPSTPPEQPAAQAVVAELVSFDEPSEAIVVVEEHQSEPAEAQQVVDFPSRDGMPQPMLELIDRSCARFQDKGDTVLAAGNIIISRGQIDDLLMDQYLSDAHVDAFAYLLAEKYSLCPGLYVPFLYISCLHWNYAQYGLLKESKMYIQHVTADSASRAELLLLPIIHNQHWTLLVGNIKLGVWSFYDSLPKPTHKGILPEMIKFLAQDIGHYFDSNPVKWPVETVSGLPVQSNSVDCGMFICKYMEAAIEKPTINWALNKDWDKKMNRFRADFVYAIFCLASKNN